MSLPALTDLRQTLPGCEVALLADLDTRVCLAASSVLDQGQETLDDLCAAAVQALSSPAGTPPCFSLLACPVDVRVFVRTGPDQPEALCLLMSPSAPLHGIEAAAQTFLTSDLAGAFG